MALAVAQIAHLSGPPGGPYTASFSSATTVGNLIVAVVNTYNGTPGTGSVTDSKSNTYTRDFLYQTGLLSLAFYSAPVTTGGTSHTVTLATVVDIANVDIAEVSGQAAASVFDASASNTASSTGPYTSGSTGTLSQADEIVFVSVGVDTGDFQEVTEDASYTLVGEFMNGTAGFVSNVAYKIVAATTAINHTWTSTFGSNPWFAGAATYKAAAGVPDLVVDDADHAHTADEVVLTIPGVFTVASATHAHTAEEVPFPPQAVPANALHAHTADGVTFDVALLTDDFNRANASTLGSAWVHDTGAFAIVSNRAARQNTGGDFAVFNTALPDPDMFVEADILDAMLAYTVIHGRTTPALRGVTNYQCFLVPGGITTTTATIGKMVSGAYSAVPGGSTTVSVPTEPFKLRLEMQGTTLRMKINGVTVVTTTDSSITTGNYAGINTAFGVNGRYDNFAAGPVSTTLVVNNASHAHTADGVTFSVGFIINDATHAHTAGNLLLPATLTVDSGAHAHTATSVSIARAVYPVAVSGRKFIDQLGGVFLVKDISSWGMLQNLSNANITQALQGVVDRHFNTVLACMFGMRQFPDWTPYQNAAGQAVFTGTPWGSSLGPAWATVDHYVAECSRLGLVAGLSFWASYGDSGNIADLSAVTTTQAYNTGLAIAQRYASYPNIIWHVMGDNGWSPTSTFGTRLDALFHGFRDGEGPVPHLIIAEPLQTQTGYQAFISQQLDHGVSGGYQWFKCSANSVYMYTNDGVVLFDNVWNEPTSPTTYPVWDSEPPYVGAGHYTGAINVAPTTGAERQNLRERTYSNLIRGGVGINWGHEAWWIFGKQGLFNTGMTWQQVITSSDTFDAQHAWDVLDVYCTDPTWAPDNTFLVAGLGSGETRAAAGSGSSTLLAYFPTSRTVTVDTTSLGAVPQAYLTPATSPATTPDQSTFFPTDFTIVAKLHRPTFGSTMTIASQAATTTTSVGWRFGFNSTGGLIYEYSTSGSSMAGTIGTIAGSIWSTVTVGTPIWVAFSFDNNTTEYTYGGYWSLDGVTWNGPSGGGTVPTTPPAFFNSTGSIRIGTFGATNIQALNEDIEYVEVRSGIGPTAGSVIWRFDALDWVSGTSWTDARGHTWTISTAAAITDVSGTNNVRLRWYDPSTGSFSPIAVGEAPSPSRNVTYPSARADGTNDWLLVMDDRLDLGVDNASHAHTADNVPITVDFNVHNASHGHVATTITLVTGLVVNDALHAHTAADVVVSTGLAVDNAAHAHTADGLIVLGVSLVVADALHAHTADNVDVAEPGVVNSAFHGHTADHVVLEVETISKIRLGLITPAALKVGTTAVTRVYLGNNQVF